MIIILEQATHELTGNQVTGDVILDDIYLADDKQRWSISLLFKGNDGLQLNQGMVYSFPVGGDPIEKSKEFLLNTGDFLV